MNNYWIDKNSEEVAEMMESYRAELEKECSENLELLYSEMQLNLEELEKQYRERLQEILKIYEDAAMNDYEHAHAQIQELQKQLEEEKNRKCPNCGCQVDSWNKLMQRLT